MELEGSSATRQSQASLTLIIGVALIAPLWRLSETVNRAPGRGSGFIMYHYTGPRRAVCTAVTGTRRACVLFSLLLRPGHRLLLPLPSSSSRYIRVYVERARYAHRPGNRDTTRVKTISSPRRCASARLCSNYTACN